MQREIRLFRYWHTLPRARNLKPKFEFQTPLAQNSPAGTSELIPFGAKLDLRWNYPSGTSELLPFGANSDLPWDWKLPEIPSCGFLFAFTCTSELIPCGTNSDLCWNYPTGTSELIPFGNSSDIPWDLVFLDITSQIFIFDFPCWDLLCLSVRGELHISPLDFNYDYPLLGNYKYILTAGFLTRDFARTKHSFAINSYLISMVISTLTS